MVKIKTGKSIKAFEVYNTLFMVLICMTILYPFINTMAKSFSTESSILAGNVSLWPTDFTIEAYKRVLESSSYVNALKVTVLITFAGTIISLFSTCGAAYAIVRRVMGYQLIFIFLIIPKFFNGGMIPTFIQINNLGIYNTLWALFLPNAFNIFNIILARNFFQALPDSVLESAEIDGCSEIQLFTRIVMPMSKPIIATLVLFEMVALWNTFLPGVMYIDDIKLQPLQVYVRNVIFNAEMSLDTVAIEQQVNNSVVGLEAIKATVLMVSILPIVCVYPFMQKYFVQGVNVGAVKG